MIYSVVKINDKVYELVFGVSGPMCPDSYSGYSPSDSAIEAVGAGSTIQQATHEALEQIPDLLSICPPTSGNWTKQELENFASNPEYLDKVEAEVLQEFQKNFDDYECTARDFVRENYGPMPDGQPEEAFEAYFYVHIKIRQ